MNRQQVLDEIETLETRVGKLQQFLALMNDLEIDTQPEFTHKVKHIVAKAKARKVNVAGELTRNQTMQIINRVVMNNPTFSKKDVVDADTFGLNAWNIANAVRDFVNQGKLTVVNRGGAGKGCSTYRLAGKVGVPDNGNGFSGNAFEAGIDPDPTAAERYDADSGTVDGVPREPEHANTESTG